MVAERGVGTRRAAWRVTASVEQKENLVDNEQLATYATEYVVKVEAESPEVRDGVFKLVDKNVVALASTGESKDLYSKTKGDYYRFLPVVLQRQVPMSLRVQKTVEVPQVRYIDEIVDEPVVVQGQVPTTQTVQKTVEASRVQFPDRVADVLVVSRRQVPGLLTQEEIFRGDPCRRFGGSSSEHFWGDSAAEQDHARDQEELRDERPGKCSRKLPKRMTMTTRSSTNSLQALETRNT